MPIYSGAEWAPEDIYRIGEPKEASAQSQGVGPFTAIPGDPYSFASRQYKANVHYLRTDVDTCRPTACVSRRPPWATL
jgi:hypothetical protein